MLPSISHIIQATCPRIEIMSTHYPKRPGFDQLVISSQFFVPAFGVGKFNEKPCLAFVPQSLVLVS